MSERTFSPKIHAFPGDGSVLIDLGEDNYLRMPAETAKRFAGRILVKANEAEGNAPVHMFMIEVEK